MSTQTTLAAAAAAHARRAWREHVDHCLRCSAARLERVRTRCAEGGMLRAAVQAAENQLAYERQQDRAPAPGQAELPLGLPGQLELYGDLTP